jgi:hypothetical protein
MKTVAFFGTVTAGATKVLVSPRINHPFELTKIAARFAQGCNNKVALRFYLGTDSDAPATGKPNGSSMLKEYGQVDYVVGNDDTKRLEHNVKVLLAGTYIKVHADNTDGFDHSIDVVFTILEKERG